MTILSPIVLFVYNRPLHTRQTVEALQKNNLAIESDLIIYSDAPKNAEAQENVSLVRTYLKGITGFKKITIIEHERNRGLADSIIDGVTSVINKHGKVIVLEDDLVTSPFFLQFMNDTLNFYKNEPNVWHISGWNYPVNIDGMNEVFFWRVMNCWGWATWSDRWNNFEKNTNKLINEFSKKDIWIFNLDGIQDFWLQVLLNEKGEINTWAIYWYASIFRNNGLCLNPSRSFVNNIGLDGSGIHCADNGKKNDLELNKSQTTQFTMSLFEDTKMVDQIKYYYQNQKKSIPVRIINKFFKIIVGKPLIL